MDRIKLLYAALSTRQRNTLKGYLGLFHRGDPKNDKQLALLRLLERNPDLTTSEAAQKMYGDPKSKAFLMLALRIYERMTEYACSSLNTDLGKYDREMPYVHGLIEYRRHMLNAHVFHEMRQPKLAVQHMQQARELAEACCAPELESDVLLRLRGTFDRHDTDFSEMDRALEKTLHGASTDAVVLGIYHDFIHRFRGRTGADLEKTTYLKTHLPRAEERLEQHYSVRAAYYTALMKVNLAILNSDFKNGVQAAELAIELIETHKGMRSPERRSEPYMQLGLLEIQFGHYASAVEHLKQGRAFLKSGTLGHCTGTIVLCYAWVYSSQYDQARAELKDLQTVKDAPYFKKSGLLDGLQDYLEACMAYLEGDPTQAWRNMQAMQDLYQDREGWGTGLRIFEVVVLVEQGEYELAETRVEALRKHVAQYAPAKREIAIYKLLRHLAHSFFDMKSSEKALALVAEVETHPWDPFAHEVIRVDEWFHRRVAQT